MVMKRKIIFLCASVFMFTLTLPLLADDTVLAANLFHELDMVRLGPLSGSEDFLLGENSQVDVVKRSLSSFKINRYETSYALWYKVRLWAEKHGYSFENIGQEGSFGARGKSPSQVNGYQPVTMINWHDAVVWCNALSEMNSLTPCYTFKGEVLRDSRESAKCDLSVCDFNADGYRLPTESEWEYAARKTQSGMQRGDLASGQVNALGKSDASIPGGEVAWTSDNSNGTHLVGTAGTPFVPETPPSPGSGNPNGSGLFDMSGNVLEFCWDWFGPYAEVKKGTFYAGPSVGSSRVMRGGSWYPFTISAAAGERYFYDANEAYNYFGFRVVATR